MAPNNGYRSMQIIGYKSHESHDYVTVDYQVGLVSNTSQPSFSLQLVATHSPIDLLSVDLFDFLSMPLPCRAASTFDFEFTRSTNFDLRLVVDPPRLRLYLVEPPQPSNLIVSRSTSTFTAKNITTQQIKRLQPRLATKNIGLFIHSIIQK
jgi:hypothetical protein